MYLEYLINAKYHISVVKRMLDNYREFESKRYLIGIINELAKASSNIIKAYLSIEKRSFQDSSKNIKLFKEIIAPKYLEKEIVNNILKSLEIERAQKESPVQFSKNDKIILLIKGRYRFLTIKRLEEFIKSVEIGILKISKVSRQV